MASSDIKVIKRRAARRRARTIPDEILHDPEIAQACSALPAHYSFEVHKTIWKLREAQARRTALQLPEGLLMFACALGDIFARFTGTSIVVLGDVTYGACCVDDLTARAVGCDFLVHYGHSCLVPVTAVAHDDVLGDGGGAQGGGGVHGQDAGEAAAEATKEVVAGAGSSGGAGEGSPRRLRGPLKTLYVFVEIGIDVAHLVACVRANFGATRHAPLTLMATIQFANALHTAANDLINGGGGGEGGEGGGGEGGEEGGGLGFTDVLVPQAKPLSPGEVLGCTSPRLFSEAPPGEGGGTGGGLVPRSGVLVFVADGRFHLEAAMIHNPQLAAYRYDPYGKVLTRERYAVATMHAQRKRAIAKAAPAERWGLVLGTLGRQGNPAVLGHLRRVLKAQGKRCVLVLLSEVFPAKLALFQGKVDAWVQVCCPRLSVDWGAAFDAVAPLLSPYEALVALQQTAWREVYPMDYYSDGSGPWTNQYHEDRSLDAKPKQQAVASAAALSGSCCKAGAAAASTSGMGSEDTAGTCSCKKELPN